MNYNQEMFSELLDFLMFDLEKRNLPDDIERRRFYFIGFLKHYMNTNVEIALEASQSKSKTLKKMFANVLASVKINTNSSPSSNQTTDSGFDIQSEEEETTQNNQDLTLKWQDSKSKSSQISKEKFQDGLSSNSSSSSTSFTNSNNIEHKFENKFNNLFNKKLINQNNNESFNSEIASQQTSSTLSNSTDSKFKKIFSSISLSEDKFQFKNSSNKLTNLNSSTSNSTFSLNYTINEDNTINKKNDINNIQKATDNYNQNKKGLNFSYHSILYQEDIETGEFSTRFCALEEENMLFKCWSKSQKIPTSNKINLEKEANGNIVTLVCIIPINNFTLTKKNLNNSSENCNRDNFNAINSESKELFELSFERVSNPDNLISLNNTVNGKHDDSNKLKFIDDTIRVRHDSNKNSIEKYSIPLPSSYSFYTDDELIASKWIQEVERINNKELNPVGLREKIKKTLLDIPKQSLMTSSTQNLSLQMRPKENSAEINHEKRKSKIHSIFDTFGRNKSKSICITDCKDDVDKLMEDVAMSGLIKIKYGSFFGRKWQKRFCLIHSRSFICKQDESDQNIEFIIPLYGCQLSLGVKDVKRDLCIKLTCHDGSDCLLEIGDKLSHARWLQILIKETGFANQLRKNHIQKNQPLKIECNLDNNDYDNDQLKENNTGLEQNYSPTLYSNIDDFDDQFYEEDKLKSLKNIPTLDETLLLNERRNISYSEPPIKPLNKSLNNSVYTSYSSNYITNSNIIIFNNKAEKSDEPIFGNLKVFTKKRNSICAIESNDILNSGLNEFDKAKKDKSKSTENINMANFSLQKNQACFIDNGKELNATNDKAVLNFNKDKSRLKTLANIDSNTNAQIVPTIEKVKHNNLHEQTPKKVDNLNNDINEEDIKSNYNSRINKYLNNINFNVSISKRSTQSESICNVSKPTTPTKPTKNNFNNQNLLNITDKNSENVKTSNDFDQKKHIKNVYKPHITKPKPFNKKNISVNQELTSSNGFSTSNYIQTTNTDPIISNSISFNSQNNNNCGLNPNSLDILDEFKKFKNNLKTFEDNF